MASIRTTKRKSLHTPSHFPTTSQPHTMPHSNVHDYLQNVKEVSPTIGEHIHFTRFSERLRRKSSTNVMSCELGNAHTPVKAPERGAIKGRPRLMRNLMKDFVQGIRKAPVVEQEEEEEEEEEDDDNDGWESPYESPEDMNPPLERIREAILRIGDRLVHARDTIFHAGRKKPAPPVRLGGVILLLLLIVCTGLVGMLRPRKNASVDNTREPTVAAVVDMPSPTPTMTIHPDPDRNDASNVPIAEVEPIETVPSTPPPPAKRVEPELEEQIAEIRLWRQEVLTLLNEKIASLTSKMDALERSIPRVNVAALMSRMEELDDRLQRERGARDVDTTGLREASSGIMADMDALRWRVSSLEEITSTHPLGQDIDERLRQYGEEFQLQIDALRAGSHTETQQPVSLHQEQGMSEEAVKQIVNETLALYSADKTGRVDYALHSAGAVVVTSATTSAYTEPIRLVPEWALFVPALGRVDRLPPETALDLNMTPGHCFAFAVVGNLAVKLAKEILVTHVSIEHIDRRVAHNNLTSAPKECALYGIHEPSDSHGELLLSFEYKTDEAPLQEFPVDSVGVYSIVRLEVKSNHGHERFTCIYRFRVHGKPSDRSQ